MALLLDNSQKTPSSESVLLFKEFSHLFHNRWNMHYSEELYASLWHLRTFCVVVLFMSLSQSLHNACLLCVDNILAIDIALIIKYNYYL